MSFYWRPYVPVAQRRAKALKKMEKLQKQGIHVQPVEIEGRTIARSFWGKAWCDHLESFSDYDNRLPRGRTYVRNGSVCHLEIKKSRIEAMVSGSELYKVEIAIKPLKSSLWKSIKQLCSGKIGSMLELLQGRLSDHVMSIVTHREQGLMPLPREISLKCSCPDWAVMCKHVAAVMYGVGSRLDAVPELLFTLRGVNADELITTDMALPVPSAQSSENVIADDKISDIFGIEMDTETAAHPEGEPSIPMKKSRQSANRKNPQKKTVRIRVVKSQKPKTKPKKAVIKVSLSSKTRKKASSTTGTVKKTQKLATIPLQHPTGSSVKKLRKRLGLSVPQFAEQLGLSSAIIYRWEKSKGRLNLQKRTLNAISQLSQQVESQ
ncbi:MAG: SWIM zinc finger family protein [Phycisphaerae bacterium]|nr:SWIM zinc finger family protein [Phycisphaerae bacterium]